MAGNILEELVKLVRGNEQNTTGFDVQQPMQGNNQNTQVMPQTNTNTSSNNQQNVANNPYQQGVLKGLQKAGEEHAYNAATMGIDPNQIMQHPVMSNNTQQQPIQNQAQTNTNPDKNTQALRPGERTLPEGIGGLFYPGSDREQPGAIYKVLTLLAGGGGYKSEATTDTAINSLLLKQLGEQQEQGKKAGVVKQDLKEFVSSWSKIPKGGPGGLKGRAGGAARFFGVGRGEYGKFQADAEALSYSIGDFVLGQTGRALTEKEREGIKKEILASASGNEAESKGRLQSTINKVNSRIREKSPQAEELPNVDTLLKEISGTKKTGKITKGNIKSITPIGE